MPAQDTTKIKEKILSYIKLKGPSLPVHVAKETEQSILFASAFLSELLSEKTLKITNMRVGSSPIYFIPGQESRLERFYTHLKSKEKDAFVLLRDKKFLEDKSQQPAMRIALRSIRDFAIPFKHGEEIYWRYFKTPMEEFKPEIIPKSKPKPQFALEPEVKIIAEIPPSKEQEKPLNIFDKEEESTPEPEPTKEPKKEKPKLKRAPAKRKTSNVNEKFFKKVKDFLVEESIEITGIEGFSKNELFLKVNDAKEKLLIAFNKKRITEVDITKAYKKAQEANLPYIVLSLGEPTKKLTDFIRAIKNLDDMKKIE